MSLRDKMMALADEFWDTAQKATERRAYTEGVVLRDASDRIREALGLPSLGSEEES